MKVFLVGAFRRKTQTIVVTFCHEHLVQGNHCLIGFVAALREQRNIERKENAKGRQWRNFPG